MSKRCVMHKNDNSGLPILLIISLVRLWQFPHIRRLSLKYARKSNGVLDTDSLQ